MHGCLDCIFNLAVCFSKGEGVKKDLIKSKKLYKNAAKKNHLDSIYNLANCYERGLGVK